MNSYTVWAVQLLHDSREIEAKDEAEALAIAGEMYMRDDGPIAEKYGVLDPECIIDGDYGLGEETWTPIINKAGQQATMRSDACPVCKASEVVGGSVDIGEQSATQRCDCIECGADWTAVYTLTENINVNTNEEKSL